MNIPNNCRECEHGMTCSCAHYGSLHCKYEKEINERRIRGEEVKDDSD